MRWLALVFVVTLHVGPSPAQADPIEAGCSALVVLDDAKPAARFQVRACTGAATDVAALRYPAEQVVTWTIATDIQTTECVWGSGGAGVSCDGPRFVPATIGSVVHVDVETTGGTVVFGARTAA